MENFVHRGDVKASRKSGEFVPIEPLTPADLSPPASARMEFLELLARVRHLRAEVGRPIKDRLSPDDSPTASSSP